MVGLVLGRVYDGRAVVVGVPDAPPLKSVGAVREKRVVHDVLQAHPPRATLRVEPAFRERETVYLTTHSTHFIYGYMASDIWLRTILIVRKETRCRHIGYSYRLAARVLLYAASQTGQHIPWPSLHQSGSTGWNEK